MESNRGGGELETLHFDSAEQRAIVASDPICNFVLWLLNVAARDYDSHFVT